MSNMNKREVFEKVKRHLLSQKQRAMSGGTCLLRAGRGLKCAVGCLIPDKAYDQHMEELILENNQVWKALRGQGIRRTRAMYSLLDALVRVHDSCHPREWRKALAEVESRHFRHFR